MFEPFCMLDPDNTADFCVGLPAKSMAADGYDVRLVRDTSSNLSEMVLQATIANLVLNEQGKVALAHVPCGEPSAETAQGCNAPGRPICR